MKVTRDGFVWLTVESEKEALKIWNSGIFTMFRLYDNDAEGEIESGEEVMEAIEKGIPIGIEVGGLDDDWVRKDAASEAHRKSCPMTSCVNCLFGVCGMDCEYQKEFMDKLEKSE